MQVCAFCQARPEGDPADLGWEPYFWCGDREISQPVCPDCRRASLRYDARHGDWESVGEHYPVYTLTFTRHTTTGQLVDVFNSLSQPTPEYVAALAGRRLGAKITHGVIDRPGGCFA